MQISIKYISTCIYLLIIFSCQNKPQADSKPKQALKVEVDSTTLLLFQKKEIVAKILYSNPTPEQVESVDFEATLIDLNKGIEFFDMEIAQTDELLEMDGCGNWYRQVLESDERAKDIRGKISNLVSIVEAVQQSYQYLKYDSYYDRLSEDAVY